MPTVSHFWELILGTIIALIPMINPLASAPTFLAITEGDTRWQMFRRVGLPIAGGPLGRAPALMIYWKHKLAAALARPK